MIDWLITICTHDTLGRPSFGVTVLSAVIAFLLICLIITHGRPFLQCVIEWARERMAAR